MNNYHHLVEEIISVGECGEDRTGVGTYSLFGKELRFDLQEGFPLLTTKKVHWKSVVGELLWFLSGSTNIRQLHLHDISIWDEWAAPDGRLGPVYGKQWRRWGTDQTRYPIDQVKELIYGIKTDPNSRRHLVVAWNPQELDEMALPPCHYAFQCNVRKGLLDMKVTMRSVDVFLGLPFNIASYAVLTHMLAHLTELVPGELIMSLGDTHIYRNHLDQCHTLLQRKPKPPPRLIMNPWVRDIDEFAMEDFTLDGYDPYPAIPAPIAV